MSLEEVMESAEINIKPAENSTALTNIDNYKLTVEKRNQIALAFAPMYTEFSSMKEKIDEVAALPMSEETSSKARRLRLDVAKIRTTTEKVRKEQKEDYLKAGQAIDGIANQLKNNAVAVENDLARIENHFKILEEQRKEKLAQDRAAELAKYDCFNIPGLGEMAEEIYNNFLTGTKINYEARKEAERKAEEERLAKEAAELEERRRVWRENERLKKEAEEREKQAEEDRKKQEDILAAEKAKADVEKKELEEKARIEREKAEAEAARIKVEQDAIIEAERAEKAKLQAEIDAKKEAEEKEKARIAREEKRARTAPDKEKLSKLAEKIDAIELPEVTSEEARYILRDVHGLLNRTAILIRSQSERIG